MVANNVFMIEEMKEKVKNRRNKEVETLKEEKV